MTTFPQTPMYSVIHSRAHDLYTLQRRGPKLGGADVPQHTTCRYPSKVCLNSRAFKANGELHRFCEHHRRRANINQKRWNATRRGYEVCLASRPQAFSPIDNNALSINAPEALKIEDVVLPVAIASSPVDTQILCDDVIFEALLNDLTHDSFFVEEISMREASPAYPEIVSL